MKNTFKIFVTLFLLVFAINQGIAQPPTYLLTAKNFSYPANNTVEFDIYMQWTNQGSSDPFQYGSCQYCFTFNTLSDDGQTWTMTNIGSDLPVALQPSTLQWNAAAVQLRYAGNLPGTPFTVSAVFPGTKVVRTRIVTNIPIFPIVPLNLAWRNAGAGLITKISYLDPQGLGQFITNAASHQIADTSGALPVELASFTSNVSRNTVSLNWATTTETNNQGFDIERKSVNGAEWTKIGNVNGNGTTTEARSYSFSDRANTGNFNYRLKQIDFNGNFAYYNLGNEVVVGVPSQYAISQNYPNPFNPSTKIDYDIPFDGKVSVLLYDLSGRQVGSLVNDVKTAGYYTVNFNASNLASGMYFYRINAEGNGNNFVSTKKMVLIK